MLEHRKFQEDQLKIELAELMRDEARERSRLAELARELDMSTQMLVDRLKGSTDVRELAMIDEYVKAKADDIVVQSLTVEAVAKRVDGKRSEVLEAMKRRKLLQALRDKQESAHLYESARIEQNELDNDTSMRFARREKRSFLEDES